MSNPLATTPLRSVPPLLQPRLLYDSRQSSAVSYIIRCSVPRAANSVSLATKGFMSGDRTVNNRGVRSLGETIKPSCDRNRGLVPRRSEKNMEYYT
jgi:hypothetical protein